MLTRIQNIRKNLAILETHTSAFAIPDGLTVSVSADGTKPLVVLCGPYSYGKPDADEIRNREAVLDLAGKWFGKDGWIQNEDYSNKYYNWTKEWNGIQITINNAKVIPRQRNGTPVPPSEFPLLLEDVSHEH